MGPHILNDKLWLRGLALFLFLFFFFVVVCLALENLSQVAVKPGSEKGGLSCFCAPTPGTCNCRDLGKRHKF